MNVVEDEEIQIDPLQRVEVGYTGSYQTTKYRTGQPWEVVMSNHNLWADYVQEDLDLLSGILTS